MKQLTFDEADRLVKEIALDSMGFATPKTVAKQYGLPNDMAEKAHADTLYVAERAAHIALRCSGALDDALRREARRNDLRVQQIRAKESAWKAANKSRVCE